MHCSLFLSKKAAVNGGRVFKGNLKLLVYYQAI